MRTVEVLIAGKGCTMPLDRGEHHMAATETPPATTNGHANGHATQAAAANGAPAATAEIRPGPALPLLPPDLRRLGGEFDVKEAARRVVRYETVTFHVMRLLGGWLAKIPEFELKFEIGRH